MITTRRAVAIVALYAAFLLLAPFAHHDLSCELKTPQHCAACASNLVGSADPHPGTASTVIHLPEAGSPHAVSSAPAELLLDVRSTGRSPPLSR